MLKPASVLVYVCQPGAAPCIAGVALAGGISSVAVPGAKVAVGGEVGRGAQVTARSEMARRLSNSRVCIACPSVGAETGGQRANLPDSAFSHLDVTPSPAAYLNLKTARCSVLSTSRMTSIRHEPDQALSVFQI